MIGRYKTIGSTMFLFFLFASSVTQRTKFSLRTQLTHVSMRESGSFLYRLIENEKTKRYYTDILTYSLHTSIIDYDDCIRR